MSIPPPCYDGSADCKHTILHSLAAVAQRMYKAEDMLASIRASDNWQTNGPGT
ncbi:hypothetical protein EDC04DRAFT_2546516, partial [Pisolithus marmoratus]